MSEKKTIKVTLVKSPIGRTRITAPPFSVSASRRSARRASSKIRPPFAA